MISPWRIPVDLAVVIVLACLGIGIVLLPGSGDMSLRVVIGLVFVLFLPGYAFIAALFPEAGHYRRDDDELTGGRGVSLLRKRGIDGIERVALSFGFSLAIVPLIALVLDITRGGIGGLPMLASISGFTIIVATIAMHRRWQLPPERRFFLPYRTWIERGRENVFHPNDRTQLLLNILLVSSVILATSGIVYAIAVPQHGERFTEFYLLTEDDDGELVASDYPAEFVQGDEASLVIGIDNHEEQTVTYTIVIQLERLIHTENRSYVVERSELDEISVTLEPGETWLHEHTLEPDIVGEDLRLSYLLYVDEPPSQPHRDNAYRDLHIWIDVHA